MKRNRQADITRESIDFCEKLVLDTRTLMLLYKCCAKEMLILRSIITGVKTRRLLPTVL